ncbi:hypothetical protein L7F22_065421 [Adiantum nelumboides]|nr:hypothetical protein [Adiantum nelumboides]
MTNFLMGKGYRDYIDGNQEEMPELPDVNPTVEQIKAFKDRNQGARKVMYWLFVSVQDTMIGHIQDATSPKQPWDRLVSIDTTNTKARKIQLKNELNTVKKENLSINDYTLKIKGIVESIASIGVQVEDDDKVEPAADFYRFIGFFKICKNDGNSGLVSDKLDKNNFHAWKFRMTNFLMGKGYRDYIDGNQEEMPELPYVNPTVEQIKAFKDRNQGARKVMYWLFVSVQDTMIGHIQDATSPKQAWDRFIGFCKICKNDGISGLVSDKLDKNNFHAWKFRMTNFLMGKGYRDYIDGNQEEMPELRDVNPTVEQIKAFKDRNQGARKVMYWLFVSVQDTMIGHIQDATSPKQAWDRLVSIDTTNTKARKIQLKNELNTVKKENLSINDYTLKIKGIVESIASIGVQVEDDDKVEVCLRGLTPAYKHYFELGEELEEMWPLGIEELGEMVEHEENYEEGMVVLKIVEP